MPRLSIIIPFSKDVQQLEESLVSVLENRPPATQILVILSDVYQDPYDIKDEVDFVFASFGEPVPACLNLAVEAAKAPIVHVVGCGMGVSPGWTDGPVRLFDDASVGAVVPCILDKGDPTKILSAGVRYRCGGGRDRLGAGRPAEGFEPETGGWYGADLFGGFYRREALESAGGFQAALGPTLGPLDMCLRLTRLGYETRFDSSSRLYAEKRLFHRTPGFRQALEDERFFWQWAGEAGTGKSIFNHGFVLTAETVCSLIRPDRAVMQWAGRLAGALSAGSPPATDAAEADTIAFPGPCADDSGVESRRYAA